MFFRWDWKHKKLFFFFKKRNVFPFYKFFYRYHLSCNWSYLIKIELFMLRLFQWIYSQILLNFWYVNFCVRKSEVYELHVSQFVDWQVQDHIFTKSHIDKVKVFLNADFDRDLELPSSMANSAPSDMDRGRKIWEESNSHLAQLQAMGVGQSSSGFPRNTGEKNDIETQTQLNYRKISEGENILLEIYVGLYIFVYSQFYFF